MERTARRAAWRAPRISTIGCQVANYFGTFLGEGDIVGGEAAERGAATGGFRSDDALGPGEFEGVIEGEGFFSAIREARSLSNWSIVAFAIR